MGRKIIVVSVLISAIFFMSCAHSSSPDLLGYDIEYLTGYYYWKHNEAPAKIDDVILAYEELQEEWPNNPHATTYNYLCEHQNLLFLFAYKDRCYYVDLYNIGYHVILLENDSFLFNEMPSSPPILDVGIMHELDPYFEGMYDTTMVTIWFDSTKTGQFVKMSRWELDIITREEKAEIESQYGDCPFLFTDDDYYGYTTLTRNDTVLVVLVFKGFKRQRRWEHIPSSLVDCSRLIPMDSLSWRPQNFFVQEGAFYDPVVKRYRIEILQSLGSDNGIKDSVVITFDGEEFV